MKRIPIFCIVGTFLVLCWFILGRTREKSGSISAKWPDAPWEYSIGILSGEHPLKIASSAEKVRNPVLTARDVTDITAKFVADPFMIQTDGMWYMFFEVLNAETDQGDIGLAISGDGLEWNYKKIVLDESFHLSYPLVFRWQGRFYMTPETHQNGAIRLYEAVNFPYRWTHKADLVKGIYVDPTIFRYDNRWWLFVGARNNSQLYLFYSDTLDHEWKPHPLSPVIRNNANIARPGGRTMSVGSQILRITQDCDPSYGNQVRAFYVTELTTDSYHEYESPESPVLTTNIFQWAQGGMHHMDPHPFGNGDAEWLACVDGCIPAQPEIPLDLVFNNGPRLLGMTAYPLACDPGDVILMRFYWKDIPLDVPENSWAVFVHFLKRRKIAFQSDYTICAGQEVYETVIKVPDRIKPGKHRILCGLYDLKTGVRYAVTTRLSQKEDAVLLPVRLKITHGKP